MRGITELVMVLAVCFLWSEAGGTDLASVSTGDIRFGIDTALFDYTGTDTLGMEIYQQLELQQFSMDRDSVVRFITTAVVTAAGGDTIAVDQWSTETEWLPGRSAVNSTVLPVTPGDHTLTVTVTDTGNGQQGRVVRDIRAEPPGRVSDIELARAVVPAPEGSTSILRKGEVLVFPAANGSFTLPEEHTAYYYVELYDLGGSSVQIQGRLETAAGETIFARPWVSVSIPEGAGSVGLVDSLDLRTARTSGLHRLVFGVRSGEDTLETEKYLVVGRSLETDSVVTAEETADIPYPGQFRLILSVTERGIFDSLDEEARSRFYTAYWQSSPVQREAFEQRCEEAEGRYSSPYRESWETDRGRVYIIYGPPDDIEAVSFQGEQVPHEIWYYYGRGNERFVFADRTGTGLYEQVFSTIEGEVSYTNWERMIVPVSGGTGQ